MRSAALVLSLASLACRPRESDEPAPPVAVRKPRPVKAAPTQAPPAEAPPAECPVFAIADLERQPAAPDSRTVELSTLVAPPAARKGAPQRVDLGVLAVTIPMHPPGRHDMFGVGWSGLEARWVEAGLAPALGPAFQAWLAARDALSDEQRLSYLLQERARYLKSRPAPPTWGAPRCTEEASARAEVAVKRAEALLEERAVALQEQLAARKKRSAAETFLLAYVIENRLPYPREPGLAELERARRMYTQVLDDRAAPDELRARAAEQLAQTELDTRDPAFARWLERVLALTRDPELRIETLIKLADIAERPDVAESRRSEVIALLEARPVDWRLAHNLAARAEGHLARGAYEKAADDALRCARLMPAEFPDSPDPWGCASVLAQALAESGEVPPGATVPRAFLGPLALAWMRTAGEHRDSDQLRYVGRRLLEIAPEAAEAPEVLVMLASTAEAEAREALLARKARDYGPSSAWSTAQRERLAWHHEPDQLARTLAALAEPRQPPPFKAPRTAAELRAELLERANEAAYICAAALRPGRSIAVEVDTRGPRVTVDGASDPSAECLRRAVRARFRSLDPAQITFAVQPR